MSVPIWEVGLLVGWHGRLDLGFGLVVPFSTIVGLASTGRHWRRVSFIGRRASRFGRILTERKWLLSREFGREGRWREGCKRVGSAKTSSLKHPGPYERHRSVVGERALRGQGRSQAGEKPAV
jgi:hypothetical protein